MLSVIIPTLNEAVQLPGLLDSLLRQEGLQLEIIIGDGGSEDNTRQLGAASAAMVITAPRGRGAQMNAAAARATGDTLLFLHADSVIDDSVLLAKGMEALQTTILGLGHERVAGHFTLQFQRRKPGHDMAYRYLEEKSAFNRVNTTNGDQGLLLSRKFFAELGGYDETLAFLEDQKIAEQIRAQGKMITLPGVLITSARRFEVEGFHRRYILMGMTMGLDAAGVDGFFRQSTGLYKAQSHTGKLYLWPFFSLIWRLLRHDLGARGSVRAWFMIGRYIRSNSWQMFYFFDIALRPFLAPKRYPCLTLHDAFFGPAIKFSFFDALTGLLAFVWFMGVLGPWFWVVEKGFWGSNCSE